MERTMGLDVLGNTINYVEKHTLYSQIDDHLHLTIFVLFIQLLKALRNKGI